MMQSENYSVLRKMLPSVKKMYQVTSIIPIMRDSMPSRISARVESSIARRNGKVKRTMDLETV